MSSQIKPIKKPTMHFKFDRGTAPGVTVALRKDTGKKVASLIISHDRETSEILIDGNANMDEIAGLLNILFFRMETGNWPI